MLKPAAIVLFSAALVGCGNDESTPAAAATSLARIALNDTGVQLCADQESESLACPVATHPAQDAENGRDVSSSDNSDGNAGFSFTKLDENGQPLSVSATSWNCVQDNVTGRIWEVKTSVLEPRTSVSPSLNRRANTNTFTWYDSSRPLAAGDRGVENGGLCYGTSSCDTVGYVAAINQTALCGFNDWRLPSRAELHSLVDYSKTEPGPMLDSNYFPNTKNSDLANGLHSDWYWTQQTVAGYAAYAWAVNFNSGGDNQMNKSSTLSLRLVRGGW